MTARMSCRRRLIVGIAILLPSATRSAIVLPTVSAESSTFLQQKLRLEPILGRGLPSHGATQPAVSREWCDENVGSVRQRGAAVKVDDFIVSTTSRGGPFNKERTEIHILHQVLSRDQCTSIIQASEERAQWTTGRHHLYPTTDIPARDLLEDAYQTCLDVACGTILPSMATLFDTSVEGLHFKDMFVAKYAPTGQAGLGVHTDDSAFSFNVLLSDPDHDFAGGGTSFHDAVDPNIDDDDQTMTLRVTPEQGSVLVHRGSLKHEGNPVTKGCRYILVGFVHRHADGDLTPAFASGGTMEGESQFRTVTISHFPLGLILEVDEGDAENSAVMVVSCDEKIGSAYAAGIRKGDCIRGLLQDHLPSHQSPNHQHEPSLELWDGYTFDQVMERLGDLRPQAPIELVIERWQKADAQ